MVFILINKNYFNYNFLVYCLFLMKNDFHLSCLDKEEEGQHEGWEVEDKALEGIGDVEEVALEVVVKKCLQKILMLIWRSIMQSQCN